MGTVASFAVWLVEPGALDPNGEQRATDVLFAVYLLGVMLTLSAGIVAALAHGQMATARAFTAGYNTGLAVSEAAEQAAGVTVERKPRQLRLVE
jgi:hypothetical protein